MNQKAEFPRLNGNTLKIIACITMLIDHIGAAIIYPLSAAGILPISMPYERLSLIYKIIRAIGRNSFPIFCFLLVEGFMHTKSRLKYAISLLVFGIISELPYDYAMSDAINFKDNNVFFTLLIGLLVIWAIDAINSFAGKKKLHFIVAPLLSVCIFATGALLAYLLKTDYSYRGITLITILYFFRYYTPINLIAGYLSIFYWKNEMYSLPAFLLMLLYNKKRGKNLGRFKYLFYAFYPAHLLIFHFIKLYCIKNL
ncbi:conjugal transfer protein TraX [Butyrivibrio sp. X503]|uniref:TraX family protein n=1 Tax=Butyrivibrio sp. X503 TaxID=2364878 RepID=UPI000EA9BC49|nr:TraX family protein [Butyrivibrio sp. X503]RKM58195.1 conjugal transfer protein TraX [Butyrivibrio sp. X503]